MTYENAPSTRMLATHCAACGRPLRGGAAFEAVSAAICRACDEAWVDAAAESDAAACGGACTFQSYWWMVVGPDASAEAVVREFGLGRDGLDEWLGTAEEAAWAKTGLGGRVPEAWGRHHARALAKLRAAIPPVFIVWGRGDVGAALHSRLGAIDDADLAQVGSLLVSAGLAERVRGGGVVMRSDATEPWCCITIGHVTEDELDADDAVLGYTEAGAR